MLLARTIHERPNEKKQARELLRYDQQVSAARDRAKTGLEQVRGRLQFNKDEIMEKERRDVQEEEERKADVEAERKRQARLQRILDRNARRLAGEQVSDTEGEDSGEEPELAENAA